MYDLICPHCSKAFKIDESGYADIMKQIRDREFDAELQKRLALAEQDKRTAIELVKAQLSQALVREAAQKDQLIERLKAQIGSHDLSQKLAINEAIQSMASERKYDELGKNQASNDLIGKCLTRFCCFSNLNNK